MPYTYKVVPFAVGTEGRQTRWENLNGTAQEFERVINEYAAAGWELHGVEKIDLSDFHHSFDVVVFKAPVG